MVWRQSSTPPINFYPLFVSPVENLENLRCKTITSFAISDKSHRIWMEAHSEYELTLNICEKWCQHFRTKGLSLGVSQTRHLKTFESSLTYSKTRLLGPI